MPRKKKLYDEGPKPPSVPLFWEPSDKKKEKDDRTSKPTTPRPKEDEKKKNSP